jgi:hypothetical protein
MWPPYEIRTIDLQLISLLDLSHVICIALCINDIYNVLLRGALERKILIF